MGDSATPGEMVLGSIRKWLGKTYRASQKTAFLHGLYLLPASRFLPACSGNPLSPLSESRPIGEAPYPPGIDIGSGELVLKLTWSLLYSLATDLSLRSLKCLLLIRI